MCMYVVNLRSINVVNLRGIAAPYFSGNCLISLSLSERRPTPEAPTRTREDLCFLDLSTISYTLISHLSKSEEKEKIVFVTLKVMTRLTTCVS